MSTLRRDFRASPHRTGSKTWEAIARLLAPKEDSAARKELLSAVGVAGQLISSESVKDFPIISAGSGDQVRIFCVYNEDATDEDNANEAALAFDATSSTDWKVSIPAEAEDVAWSKTELSKCSKRISVREKSELFDNANEAKEAASSELKVDLGQFLKP